MKMVEDFAPSQDMCKIVGRSIRYHRECLGMKLVELSESTGITKSQISLIEHGKTNISIKTIERIAKALGIPEACLFINTDESPLKVLMKNIRYYREKKKMTLLDVSFASGISKGHLSSLENGNRPITMKHIKLLAMAYELPLSVLFIPTQSE